MLMFLWPRNYKVNIIITKRKENLTQVLRVSTRSIVLVLVVVVVVVVDDDDVVFVVLHR